MCGSRRDVGFTLIELLIVILLIATLGGIFLPSAGGALGLRIRNASRVIAAELEYTSQRAIATGLTHRWVVDFDRQVFRTEHLFENEAEEPDELPTHSELLDLAPRRTSSEYVPVENLSGEWRSLDDPEVRVDEVRIGDGKVREGSVGIAFAPDGGADQAEIWLLDDTGVEWRIRVLFFTGEVRIEEATRE